MNPTVISVLSAVAAAAWSVWTWQSERQKARDIKRDEMSAQYVNTFIFATQELQRKLFRILEEDELEHYRMKLQQAKTPLPIEPASPFALDLLYDISVFFGWSMVTFRFGPYTRDAHMIAMMAHVGDTFDNRKRFPGDAFRFTLAERVALGETTIKRMAESAHGPSFAIVSRFKYEEILEDAKHEGAGLFRTEKVHCTLSAIDRAIEGEPLEGRERLAHLQNLLVDLLSYLEKEEGFRLAYGERRKAQVDRDYLMNHNGIEILHKMPGRVRMRVPSLHANPASAADLQPALESIASIKSVRINTDACCVIVEHSKNVAQPELIQTLVTKVEDQLSTGN
jgi:hypothetical protein